MGRVGSLAWTLNLPDLLGTTLHGLPEKNPLSGSENWGGSFGLRASSKIISGWGFWRCIRYAVDPVWPQRVLQARVGIYVTRCIAQELCFLLFGLIGPNPKQEGRLSLCGNQIIQAGAFEGNPCGVRKMCNLLPEKMLHSILWDHDFSWSSAETSPVLSFPQSQ